MRKEQCDRGKTCVGGAYGVEKRQARQAIDAKCGKISRKDISIAGVRQRGAMYAAGGRVLCAGSMPQRAFETG